MEGIDDTWESASRTRIFTLGIALGSVLGLVVGSAIGITLGQRSVRALRDLLEDALRRHDQVDFEVLAQ